VILWHDSEPSYTQALLLSFKECVSDLYVTGTAGISSVRLRRKVLHQGIATYGTSARQYSMFGIHSSLSLEGISSRATI
jgi:hypothetical protein